MGETVKNKDADKAKPEDATNLDEGLEETFPASDPVSATTYDPSKRTEAEKGGDKK